MDTHQRADSLRALIVRLHKHEGARLLNAQWRGQVTAQQKSLARVKRARKMHLAMIDAAVAEIPGPKSLDTARQQFATLQLDIAEAILKEHNSVENRLEKIREYSDGLNKQRQTLERIGHSSAADASGALQEWLDRVEQVKNFFLELATNKLKYQKIAVEFLTGKTQLFLVKYISKATGKVASLVASKLGKALPDAQEIAALRAYLFTENFSDATKAPKWLRALDDFISAKWFKYGVPLIEVVTTFFSEMATKGSWANAVAKSSLVAGFTIATVAAEGAISAAVTSTLATMGGALTGLFSAAAATVEVPPVAVALVAAGIVTAVGMGLYKMFDVIVASLFGNLTVSPSMRLPMSTSTYAEMSHTMSSEMATSLLPD